MEAVAAYRTYIDFYKRRAGNDYPYNRDEIFDILPQNFRIAVAEPGALRTAYLAAADLDALYVLIRGIETGVRKERERLSISVSKSFDMKPPPVPGQAPVRRRGRQVALIATPAAAPLALPTHFQYQPASHALQQAAAAPSPAPAATDKNAKYKKKYLKTKAQAAKLAASVVAEAEAARRAAAADAQRASVESASLRAQVEQCMALVNSLSSKVAQLQSVSTSNGNHIANNIQQFQQLALSASTQITQPATAGAPQAPTAQGQVQPPNPFARAQRWVTTNFYRDFRRAFNSFRGGRYRPQANAVAELAKHPFPTGESCCWCLGKDHPLDVCAIYVSAGQPL